MPNSFPVAPAGVVISAGSRLHSIFYDLFASIDAFTIAITGIIGAGIPKLENIDLCAAFIGARFDATIEIPWGWCFHDLLENKPLTRDLYVRFRPIEAKLEIEQSMSKMIPKTTHLTTTFAEVAFIKYYEQNIEFIKKISNNNIRLYPSPWDFARVVRNSITHNGINWSDKTLGQVSWYDLTYSHIDNGKTISHVDLVLSDFIILIIEMDMFIKKTRQNSYVATALL